jgi:hypothetical protein
MSDASPVPPAIVQPNANLDQPEAEEEADPEESDDHGLLGRDKKRFVSDGKRRSNLLRNRKTMMRRCARELFQMCGCMVQYTITTPALWCNLYSTHGSTMDVIGVLPDLCEYKAKKRQEKTLVLDVGKQLQRTQNALQADDDTVGTVCDALYGVVDDATLDTLRETSDAWRRGADMKARQADDVELVDKLKAVLDAHRDGLKGKSGGAAPMDVSGEAT